MNSVLAKTVAENQKDWDLRLPFVMAAYRASRHDANWIFAEFLSSSERSTSAAGYYLWKSD